MRSSYNSLYKRKIDSFSRRTLLAAGLIISAGLQYSFDANAQSFVNGGFTQIDVDGGGWFTGFAAHSSGRLYGRTDVGGAYRFDSNTQSWTWLNGSIDRFGSSLVHGIAVNPGNVNDPANSDVIYMATGTSLLGTQSGSGIWKSTDSGNSWNHVLQGVNFSGNDEIRIGGSALTIDPNNSNNVYAGSRNGLYFTNNSGGTWNEIGQSTFNNKPISSIHIGSTSPVQDHLLVAAEGGVYVQTAQGGSFSQIVNMDTVYRIDRQSDGTVWVVGRDNAQGSSFGSTATNRVLKISATNWNQTATYTTQDLTASANAGDWSLGLLKVLDDDSVVVGSVNAFERTVRTFNGGASWNELDMNLVGNKPIYFTPNQTKVSFGRNEILQDPSDSSRWYLAGGFGPKVSTDQGSSWEHINDGIGEIVGHKVNFHPTNPDVVFLPAVDVIGSFIYDASQSNGLDGSVDQNLRGILPDFTASASVEALMNGNNYTVLGVGFSDQPILIRSSDAGATWSATVNPTGLPSNKPLVGGLLAPDNPNEMLVIVGNRSDTNDSEPGIYRSTDNGQSFTQSTGIGFDGDIAFLGDEFRTYNSLYANDDPAFIDHRYAFLNGRGFYTSDDRGASWTRESTALPTDWGVMAQNGTNTNELWVNLRTFDDPQLQGKSVWKSLDMGQTWQEVSGFSFPDLANGLPTPLVDVYGDEVVVWGQREGDTELHIYYSGDGGVNWDRIDRDGHYFTSLGGLAIDPHRPGHIWISTSGRSYSLFTVIPAPATSSLLLVSSATLLRRRRA